MTIQLTSPHGKSKGALKAALEAGAEGVRFYDPSLFSPVRGGQFNAGEMTPGESFPVVMDHPKRTRFATVTRTKDGWRVG